MAQRRYLSGHQQCGMYCSQCQAVAWYTFNCSQAEAAKTLGGHMSIAKMFYCPRCARRHINGVQLPQEMVDLYMRRCWATPSQLWAYAGLAGPPPDTCPLMSRKIKLELVEDATSDFATSLWGDLQPLEAMVRLHPPPWMTPALPVAATTPTWWNPAAPTGPPGAASAPTDPDSRVAELLGFIETLHQELIQTTRRTQELAERLRGCHNELQDLLRQ